MKRRAILAGSVGAALVAGTGRAWAAPIPSLPIGLFVAGGDDPVVTQEWLALELSEANRLLAPQELSTVVAWRRPLAAEHAALENAGDRDALAKHLVAGAINVFVVGSLRDVDDPKRMRMGVRWRLRKNLQKDYVILSAAAHKTTLCHELGHALGLPHSFTLDNVMSYRRENPEKLAFDVHQGRVMRQTARVLWASKRLLAPG
jgi:hypothetical protein